MAEVKWVKLTTDMFDNRKIRHLRRLPEGNNIVLIWVMLLTMAGRCNSGGMIFLTENIPYTPKMLADELGFEENTVLLALDALKRLDMILTDNGVFTIAGWEEYQNIEGMDKIREQNRLRQKKWYDKQKALSSPNAEPNVSLTSPNGTEQEKEQDIDITTTTACARACEAPYLLTLYMYFKGKVDNPKVEAEKFEAYNANRGWDCLPDWQAKADLWIANIGG